MLPAKLVILAFDIGASKIRSAIVSGNRVLKKRIVKTPKSKEKIKKAIFDLIESYDKPDCICLGVASFIRNGKTKNTPNMDFSGVDVKNLIRSRYHVPVYADNDANCAGLAELVYGNGKGKKNFVLITVGTGIGGALIMNGELFRGNGYAGEPGHMIIEGKILEHLCSGPGTAKLAKKYGLKDTNTYLLKILADKGNKQAIKTFKESGKYLGIGLLNFAYIFDPEIIIVGGGLANVPYILKEAQRVLREEDKIQRNIRLIKAKLGDDAGLIGASILAREKTDKQIKTL